MDTTLPCTPQPRPDAAAMRDQIEANKRHISEVRRDLDALQAKVDFLLRDRGIDPDDLEFPA